MTTKEHDELNDQMRKILHLTEKPVEGIIRLWCERDNPDRVIGVRFPLSERARR